MNDKVKVTIGGVEVGKFVDIETTITPPATVVSYHAGYWIVSFLIKRFYPVMVISKSKPTKRKLRKWRRKVRKSIKF